MGMRESSQACAKVKSFCRGYLFQAGRSSQGLLLAVFSLLFVLKRKNCWNGRRPVLRPMSSTHSKTSGETCLLIPHQNLRSRIVLSLWPWSSSWDSGWNEQGRAYEKIWRKEWEGRNVVILLLSQTQKYIIFKYTYLHTWWTLQSIVSILSVKGQHYGANLKDYFLDLYLFLIFTQNLLWRVQQQRSAKENRTDNGNVCV